MSVLEVREQTWGARYLFHCPGCDNPHAVDCRTDGQHPSWSFDGNLESPTFSPSLMIKFGNDEPPDPDFAEFMLPDLCHSFIRAGQIEFLPDCSHHMAGQTVPLPTLPAA